MVAFSFRMSAPSAGEVNRTHPATIEPALNDATNPATFYGEAVLYNGTANDVRAPLASDTAVTHIDGIIVRPYPQQAPSAPQPYGGTGTVAAPFGYAGTPPAGAPVDVLKAGYISVPVVGTPNKGGAVFVWIAASAAPHVQGGFEAAATGGSTIALETDGRTYYNGPTDANGIGELCFNV